MKKTVILISAFLLLVVLVSNQTLKATHFWDCSGGACDSRTLQPWDQNKYRYAP